MKTYIGMSCPRATYDEVVDYIDKEMILAANDLPDRRDRQNIARATKGRSTSCTCKSFYYTPLVHSIIHYQMIPISLQTLLMIKAVY